MLKGFFFKVFMAEILISIPSAIFAQTIFSSTIGNIPPEIQKTMIGKSWDSFCPVKMENLSYLKLSYWGFDNKPHIGELIVFSNIAKDTASIFKQLFENHFKIQHMQLPESLPKEIPGSEPYYNTSGFYCKKPTDTKTFSKHSYGLAVDVNKRYMPNSNNQEQSSNPENNNSAGMIKVGEKPFLIFTEHGWYWGGFFPKTDYSHFEKIYMKYYSVDKMEYLTPDKRL